VGTSISNKERDSVKLVHLGGKAQDPSRKRLNQERFWSGFPFLFRIKGQTVISVRTKKEVAVEEKKKKVELKSAIFSALEGGNDKMRSYFLVGKDRA